MPGICVRSNIPAVDESEEEETQMFTKCQEFYNRHTGRRTEVKEESQKNHLEESKIAFVVFETNSSKYSSMLLFGEKKNQCKLVFVRLLSTFSPAMTDPFQPGQGQLNP